MHAQILSGTDGLTDEEPCLWETVQTGEEDREKREALNVCELSISVVDDI